MTVARPRHPNNDIEAAVQFAESRGWTFVRQGSHVWGILDCPSHARDGRRLHVYSTPRDPFAHAKDLKRDVRRCRHQAGEQDAGDQDTGDQS